jgi:diguanylate cyclase (GGDEF)-like protein
LHPTAPSPSAANEDPQREAQRLAALDGFDLLDTPPEESFDRIVRLIRNVFDVPIALVSMMDGHRQWHKASLGIGVCEAERRETFCRYPVATGKPLIINDARLDPELRSNPNVTCEGGIRFYAGVPLKTREGGHVIGTVCAIGTEPREFDARDLLVLADIAGITMHEIELRQQAETDFLTGLLSRRAFKDQGSSAIRLAQRHNYPLSCIALDIDHFKLVNDTHGHAAGDAVLKQVALACKNELRVSDVLGRIGGEEFAAILPHTSSDQATKVAEKLRTAVKRSKVKVGNVVLKVTASFGIAALEGEGKELEALLAEADEALYEAKVQGRDRCVASTVAPPQRRRVLKGARIVFNNNSSTLDCTVRSLDQHGAGLDVWNAYDIPDQFDLIIPSDKLHQACTVTERRGKHLEIDFC